MVKRQLVDKVAENTGLSRQIASDVIDVVIQAMTDTFAKGEKIELRRFGIFKVIERKAKTARNMHNNTAVHLPAYNTVVFKPSPDLKKLL